MLNRRHGPKSRSSPLWKNLALLAVSLGVVLLAAEFVVARVAPQSLAGTFRVQDERGLTLHYKNLVFPLPSGPEYVLDSRGLRVDPSRVPERPILRVLAVGDSFTFGWRLNVEDTYVSRLQRLVDSTFGAGRVEIANAGHSGWGTADYVSFVEHYGEELEADAIIVFLNAFDVDRSVRSGRYELVQDRGGDLEERSLATTRSRIRQLGRVVPGYQWLLANSHLTQLVRNVAVRGPTTPTLSPADVAGTPEHIPLLRALFRRLRAVCDSRGIALQVVTTGFLRADVPNMAPRTEQALRFFDEADEFFAGEGIPYFDIGPAFAARVNADFRKVVLADDPHPNADGAAIIAELNWPVLKPWLEGLLTARVANR